MNAPTVAIRIKRAAVNTRETVRNQRCFWKVARRGMEEVENAPCELTSAPTADTSSTAIVLCTPMFWKGVVYKTFRHKGYLARTDVGEIANKSKRPCQGELSSGRHDTVLAVQAGFLGIHALRLGGSGSFAAGAGCSFFC